MKKPKYRIKEIMVTIDINDKETELLFIQGKMDYEKFVNEFYEMYKFWIDKEREK